MMRSALFGAAALALATTAAVAAENTRSANYILPGCRAFLDEKYASDQLLQGACVGTVRGIVFMGSIANISHGKLGRFEPSSVAEDVLREYLCVDSPDGVTTGEMVRIVLAYMEARPARMHENFDGLALEALRDAWPCK